MSHTRKAAELDARSLTIHFSPGMRRALCDLEAAVHFSEHFDSDIQRILQRWTAGKAQSVHDVLIGLPLIAAETFRHVRATGDERAQEAWSEICNQMPEKGFALALARNREKTL